VPNNFGGCKLPACGDGIVNDEEEECDDGNNTDYDGCNSVCKIEAGYDCTNDLGKMSVCKTICGDSLITGFNLGGYEQCDAGDKQGIF